MTAQDALISVVVAAYNVADTLHACLDSLHNQTHHNVEILVVDDLSQDDTLAVAHAAQQRDEQIIVILRAQNGGPAAARNAALERERGEWIAIVDAARQGRSRTQHERLDRLIERAHRESADHAHPPP